MSDRMLYRLHVPSDAQDLTKSDLRRNVSEQGVISGQASAVESISLEPGQRILRGTFKGKYADLLTEQFEGLFNAGSIAEVAYYDPATKRGMDGYYTLKNVTTEPADPRETSVYTFDGVLTKVGTRNTHWRAVKTSSETVDNPFGAGTAATIAIPERATKARWFDPIGGAIEDATIQQTVQTEFQAVDVYDTTEPTFADPTLIFDLEYRHEGQADMKVWDTRGVTKIEHDTTPPKVGTAVVGETVVGSVRFPRWQRVFTADHEFTGEIVLENGAIRLRINEDAGTIRVFEWSSHVGRYVPLTLGSSDWSVFDVDLLSVSEAATTAHVEFYSHNGSSYYALNATLTRGDTGVLWTVPENQSGTIPSGLKTKLDPVALSTDTSVRPKQTVARRGDVRR